MSELPKPRFTLIPPRALTEVARVLAVGAVQYDEAEGEAKWRSRSTPELLDSAMRHLWAHLAGEVEDEGTTSPHLACAAARVLMALDAELSRGAKRRITRRRGRAHGTQRPA